MELQALFDQVRRTMATLEQSELPPFPGLLACQECHPDFLRTMVNGGGRGWFLFSWVRSPQRLGKYSPALAGAVDGGQKPPVGSGPDDPAASCAAILDPERESCRPVLWWCMPSLTAQTVAAIDQVVTSLLPERVRAEGGCALAPVGGDLGPILGCGFVWRLTWQALPVGTLRVLGAVQGVVLPHTACLVECDLLTMVELDQSALDDGEPEWVPGVPLASLAAMAQVAVPSGVFSIEPPESFETMLQTAFAEKRYEQAERLWRHAWLALAAGEASPATRNRLIPVLNEALRRILPPSPGRSAEGGGGRPGWRVPNESPGGSPGAGKPVSLRKGGVLR
jgi:hypothetical protein